MGRKAKQQRMAHNKKTSGKKANATKKSSAKNSQKTSSKQQKPSKAKVAEQEARREEKIAAAAKKTKTKDAFKKAGIIAVCVILVVALGLPATIFAFGGAQTTTTEETTVKTTSKTLSKSQHQFLEDSGIFDNFLVVDKDTGVTLTDLYSGKSTPEITAVADDIAQSGQAPASRLTLPENMTFEEQHLHYSIGKNKQIST